MQSRNPKPQAELALDHVPAQEAQMEPQMRHLFETRWSQWHRAKTYEEAVADPFTRRMLLLTVLHMPKPTVPRRRRGFLNVPSRAST
jgi:hypothetical protein